MHGIKFLQGRNGGVLTLDNMFQTSGVPNFHSDLSSVNSSAQIKVALYSVELNEEKSSQ